MKPDMRRFAPGGLYISIIAALVSIGLFIIYRQFDLKLQISFGLIIIGLALFALLDPDRARIALTGRQARYGSNVLVLSIAFLGIIIVINYFVFSHSKRWDLTEDKQFTLTPETQETLKSLPESVNAQAFFTKGAYSLETARSLLEQYESLGEGKFTFEIVDPDANPALAEQAKITHDGTIVLTMEGRQEPVTTVSEQELTGALVRLLNPEKREVFFISGHGELSLDGSGQDTIEYLKRTLESKNYGVNSLNLLIENKIPEDAKVLIIAGSNQPLNQSEVDLIKSYLDRGGSLIFMTEPSPVTDFGDKPDPLADYLEGDWSISAGSDIIVDLTSQQPFAPYAASYGSSPITEDLKNTVTQFPTARSLSVSSEAASGLGPVELVFTAPQSWAETTLDNLSSGTSEIAFDPEKDQAGPISLAVSAENFETGARLVAFGDSDFIIDSNFVYYANGDLIVNAIDWAAGQEDLISLTPKSNTERTLIPPQTTAMNLILLATVVLVPGVALVGGIMVFIQRRRRM